MPSNVLSHPTTKPLLETPGKLKLYVLALVT
jgi:hypothetical protein